MRISEKVTGAQAVSLRKQAKQNKNKKTDNKFGPIR